MTTEAKPAPKPNPWGSKKRYSILLPQELAERFERVAKLRNGAKSALVEEALDRRLNPEKYPLIDDALLRRLDEQAASLATLKRDAAINTEMISLFVRYFLTITPPLADSEQQPARTLGRRALRGGSSPRSAAASPPIAASCPTCWSRSPSTTRTCSQRQSTTRHSNRIPPRALRGRPSSASRPMARSPPPDRRRRPMADLFSLRRRRGGARAPPADVAHGVRAHHRRRTGRSDA